MAKVKKERSVWWGRVRYLFFVCVIYPIGVVGVFNYTYIDMVSCTVTGVRSVDGRFWDSSYVQTRECGEMYIRSVRFPRDMDKAGFVEFLEENEGKKFVFINDSIRFGGREVTKGIVSTTPVE